MVDHAIGRELAQLMAVGAEDGALAQPPHDRHAMAPRDGRDFLARPVNDDASPFRGTATFMKQEVGRETRAMLGARARPGGERAGEHRKTENEAPPHAGPARSSINRHD
jgi:hypothetical protein